MTHAHLFASISVTVFLLSCSKLGRHTGETKSSLARGMPDSLTQSVDRNTSNATKSAVLIEFVNSSGTVEKCFGTLIGKGQVLTASYCAVACSNTVLQYWNGTEVKEANCDTSQVLGNPKLSLLKSADADFLKQGIPFDVSKGASKPSNGQALLTYGFDSDGSLMESTGGVEGVNGNSFEHSCSTSDGWGGGLIVTDDNPNAFVGVHTGSGTAYNIGDVP